MIQRPDLEYNDAKHEYRLNGEKLLGVSTVSKIGDTDVWGVASAWAFRIGVEGTVRAANDVLGGPPEDAYLLDADRVRQTLKERRETPWHKTDDSKARGNAIHAALESLAQHGTIPVLADFPKAYHGYIRGIMKWYLDYRPEFEAVEVQVVSETHKFAGRYDIRCWVPGTGQWSAAKQLLAVDLKTGKRVYPTQHFPQLAGYELAGVEMGYPATDGQYILNVHEDGSYEFERSCATAEHFLAYLAAHRAILDIKAKIKEKP